MSDGHRALIGRDLCVGSGACELEDPDHFRIADDGIAETVGSQDELDTERLIFIADSCPARAISVIDGQGSPVWTP
jgi:ferredoxin